MESPGCCADAHPLSRAPPGRSRRKLDRSSSRLGDGDPLIGPVPGYGLWVSAGHFRTGAKEAPATAMLVAEALVTGTIPPLLAAFAPATQGISA